MPHAHPSLRHACCLAAMASGLVALISGCASSPTPTGVNYPAPHAALATPTDRDAMPQESNLALRNRNPAGPQLDAQFERSAFLTDTFYKNPDALVQQVEKTGAMGVNRGWESGARKGADWYIEEQRFADTLIGAGVNRNRTDLIDAGLRALEWGFSQQSADGGFPCRDPHLGASYFVAATGHSLWLLQTTGIAQKFEPRIHALRGPLERAAMWLAANTASQGANGQYDTHVSRYLLTGYALGVAGLLTNSRDLSAAGQRTIATGVAQQLTSGVFPEKNGFDTSFQAEGLVYLIRYFDHVANAETLRTTESALRLGLHWLENRINAQGVVLSAGNTRTGNAQERDRTGQPRRVSTVAVSRAFGLARYALAEQRYDRLARLIANAKQPN